MFSIENDSNRFVRNLTWRISQRTVCIRASSFQSYFWIIKWTIILENYRSFGYCYYHCVNGRADIYVNRNRHFYAIFCLRISVSHGIIQMRVLLYSIYHIIYIELYTKKYNMIGGGELCWWIWASVFIFELHMLSISSK